MADALIGIFGLAAEKQDTDFTRLLDKKFKDQNTTRQILETLENLRLPLPEKENQFLDGTEGALIFSNHYGVVIRIEYEKPSWRPGIERVNNNPWILQPLGTFTAGNAVIEVCPGCKCLNDQGMGSRDLRDELTGHLEKTGVTLWDDSLGNIGLLPFKTPSFPKGVPIVIDRLGVAGLSNSLIDIKKALEKIGTKQDPQDTLYNPLREALKTAWPEPGQGKADPEKMELFWQLCLDYVQKGKLIAGWNEGQTGSAKTTEAMTSARLYDRKIKPENTPG